MIMTKVPSVSLNNGVAMPILGLGTWKSKPGEVAAAVEAAIDIGYRHFDCALVYQNEKEVGAGLSAKLREGEVKREELFITSKLWCTYHRPDLVEVGLKESLSNLGLEYLDLYLIHWPFAYQEESGLFPTDENEKIRYSNVDFLDTWKAMEECVKKGLTKSIGVSNFNSEQLAKVLNVATIKPVVNQVECHPYLNQKKLSDFCKENGVVITAYSPLGSPDRPWAKPGDVQLMEDAKLITIAKTYGKSPAQILIRYQIERKHVVIPKSVTKTRIQENFNVFDFTLDATDVETIDTFDCNGRVCHLNWINDHPDYPFHVDF